MSDITALIVCTIGWLALLVTISVIAWRSE